MGGLSVIPPKPISKKIPVPIYKTFHFGPILEIYKLR